ncbi:glycosyl hydrolase family 8 [Labrenzia sp. 011]|uniref:glycosyl hydrolase family 8 n=1 Tax=Labrenzia sp. 011 TaxID=2171494 RepID=UPI000D50F16D|nr:glycosyl hydrolase family 8 [Labrenzia sp. 011]PVB60303.1 endoglucanase [Labrenzia sp. 011]
MKKGASGKFAQWIVSATVMLSSSAISVSAQVYEPQPGTISQAEWYSYVSRFVTSSGRVVDNENGNISHSESQGYGLLLAYLSNDQVTFDQIWSFTETNMRLRDDGLIAWKWDPATEPHIKDINNASDGDVLVAYSLALAARNWARPELEVPARNIADAIALNLVFQHDGKWLLRPAASGFGAEDGKDGPVINLSYWIFEAIPVLAELTGAEHWNELSNNGLQLLQEARFGADMLPSDWISLHEGVAPAASFPTDFGYNAIRIPLYLIRAGNETAGLLEPFVKFMGGPDRALRLVNVLSGKQTETLTDPGYVSIGAALECIFEGKPLPDDVKTFQPTSYYPSTLHLLVLSFLAERHPVCL